MSAAPTPASVVIVAMEEEAAPFLERAARVGDLVGFGNGARRDLVVDETPVVLLRSGIGFANAVAAAAYALYSFGPDVPVVSAGTAGGLAAGVQVGEVVVGARYVNLNADATAFGYALGQVPGMPADYAGDAALSARALAVGSGGEPGGGSVGGSVGDPEAASAAGAAGQIVRSGVIGSSEAFVTSGRALQFRADFPGVLAVDMESAAIAQFAHSHGQRFVSVRAISDLCAPDGTEFLTHVDDAAARSAATVLALLAA